MKEVRALMKSEKDERRARRAKDRQAGRSRDVKEEKKVLKQGAEGKAKEERRAEKKEPLKIRRQAEEEEKARQKPRRR